MKKFFMLCCMGVMATSSMIANAEDFTVPEPQIIVPIGGQAELLNNMFEVTWGYYRLIDNAGDEPITAQLTFPDGTVTTVKGEISDVNKEGQAADSEPIPTTQQNGLMFRNFMTLDYDSMMYIQQYGTYTVKIPEGVVLVNGVENPAAELSFRITGIQEEQKFMNNAEVLYPTSLYSSILYSVSVSWDGQEISLTDPADNGNGTLYTDIDVILDGESTITATATINKVYDSGENDTEENEIYILNISLPDFLFASDATIVDFILQEGIVKNANGEINPAQIITFSLFEQSMGTATPADGTTLKKGEAQVLVTWDGIRIDSINGTIVARQSGANDIILPVEMATEGAAILIDMAEIAPGSYEIIIPEGYVIILTEEGDVDKYAMNSEMVLNYKIEDEGSDGINEIKTSEATFDVYSVNGASMFKNCDPEAMRGLQPGLYIINGKKTIIR